MGFLVGYNIQNHLLSFSWSTYSVVVYYDTYIYIYLVCTHIFIHYNNEISSGREKRWVRFWFMSSKDIRRIYCRIYTAEERWKICFFGGALLIYIYIYYIQNQLGSSVRKWKRELLAIACIWKKKTQLWLLLFVGY